jgi:hypothetical protein
MDPFEDFEFKPLTEGLGFHKKAEKIKTDIKSMNLGQEKAARTVPDVPPRSLLHATPSELELAPREARPASQSISDLIASLPPSLDFIEDKATSIKASVSTTTKTTFELSESFSEPPQIFQPLGRDDYKMPSMSSGAGATSVGSPLSAPLGSSMSSSMGTTLGSVLPTAGAKAPTSGAGFSVPTPGTMAGSASAKAASSPYRERLDESFARAFPHAEKAPRKDAAVDETGLQAIPASFAAGFLDAMVAAGVAIIALVVILALTHINLMGLLNNAQTDGQTQLHLVLLFVAVLQIYMLTARGYFGASLGEWAFDLQLGTAQQRANPWYPVQVAWRGLVVTVTGLVVLPLLSMIARRDLTKYLTGLQLYRHG